EHLELTLHPHPFEVTPEATEVGVDRKSRPARALPIADGQVDLLLPPPPDVSVPQQRYEVVCYWAFHRILEVEDARVGRRAHQVARMVVAVDEHLRLREIVVQDLSKRVGEHSLLLC